MVVEAIIVVPPPAARGGLVSRRVTIRAVPGLRVSRPGRGAGTGASGCCVPLAAATSNVAGDT